MIASKGAISPGAIQEMAVVDFWTWMMAFGEIAEEQIEALERMKQER
jgi:hypothetical protein